MLLFHLTQLASCSRASALGVLGRVLYLTSRAMLASIFGRKKLMLALVCLATIRWLHKHTGAASATGPSGLTPDALASFFRRIASATFVKAREDLVVSRTIFGDMAFSELPTHQGSHTHPLAAADRSGAASFADRFAHNVGMTNFKYQMSNADIRNDRQGSREHYWVKDLGVPRRDLVLPPDSVIAMDDVDQYVDMPHFLATHNRPALLYTFQPHAAARVSGTNTNYSYCFREDGKVDYRVTGGMGYTHYVWNWSIDHFVAREKLAGITIKSTAYLVDRRMTSPDHELILLTPLGHWNWFGSLFSSWLYATELKRVDPIRNGFVRLLSIGEQGVFISTGLPDNYIVATTTASVDTALRLTSETSKYPLNMAQVQSHTGDRESAAVLLAYHLKGSAPKPDIICPVGEGVRRYQFKPHRYDPAAKSGMTAFMSPMVHDAFVPDVCEGNEKRAIAGRVKEVKPQELPMTAFLVRVMHEFTEQFIPHAHQLDPVPHEEVVERQPRPAQRRILENSYFMKSIRLINSFVKREPYQNIKDPRVISTINGVDKREYSRFIYALDDTLKEAKWYAFGKSPYDIAHRVAHICSQAQTVVNSDFSRFDGHGSNLMRELERLVLMRAFKREHHDIVNELHQSQFGLKAYGSFGTKYATDYSRASGSPETSAFNSIVNAFVAFLTIRSTLVDGVYPQAAEAYAALGIYGGDDGLTAAVHCSNYVRCASMIGQELTAESVYRGNLGVKFLARIYGPDVWFGSPDSCCDIPRQLSKFHLTVAMASDITATDKLIEKARAVLCSDKETPVLGAFCTKVMALAEERKYVTKMREEELRTLRSWNITWVSSTQYPNENIDWSLSYMSAVMPNFEYTRFGEWLDRARSLDALLQPPMFQAPTEPAAKAKNPVVMDGEIFPREGKKETFAELKARKIAAGTFVERAQETREDRKHGHVKRSTVSADPDIVVKERKSVDRTDDKLQHSTKPPLDVRKPPEGPEVVRKRVRDLPKLDTGKSPSPRTPGKPGQVPSARKAWRVVGTKGIT